MIGGPGDDTFRIDADCEAMEGEVIDGGDGDDTVESHLSQSQLASAGVTIVDVENFVTISEHPAGDDHCLPFPYEEGPFHEPVVELSWVQLPDPDSVYTTTQGVLTLHVENTADVGVDVDLTFSLLVRGEVVEQLDDASLAASASTNVSVDLDDFIPAGANPQAVDHEIPLSAVITTWATITASSQPFGRAFAPMVYGHIEPLGGGEVAKLYRDDALHDTYNHGDLAHMGRTPNPWSGTRLGRIEASGSLGIPGY
jgi:hypothetical protein